MLHVKQPTGTTCAQACAAMYLSIPIDEVLRELPAKRSGTKHRDLINFLRSKGAKCPGQFSSAYRRAIPPVAIVRITWPCKKAHVVLKLGVQWHDPLLPGSFTGVLPASREWMNGGRVTSYLELQ